MPRFAPKPTVVFPLPSGELAATSVADAGDAKRLDLPDLVFVRPGEIRISDTRSKRSWSVDVASIQIGVHQVTQAQYAAVTSKRPSTQKGDRLPVTDVSWLDAVQFCNELSRAVGLPAAYGIDNDDVTWDTASLGYRLPTEAEWEHACRAGTEGPRYADLDTVAWYRKNSDEQPHEVMTKGPNAWGIHYSLGNVWEWCWDLIDPVTYGSYRVLRGGGWFDQHWSCRAST